MTPAEYIQTIKEIIADYQDGESSEQECAEAINSLFLDVGHSTSPDDGDWDDAPSAIECGNAARAWAGDRLRDR